MFHLLKNESILWIYLLDDRKGVERLIEEGVDLNHRYENGQWPIHLAIKNGISFLKIK